MLTEKRLVNSFNCSGPFSERDIKPVHMYEDTLESITIGRSNSFSLLLSPFFSWIVWARILIKTSKTASFQLEIPLPHTLEYKRKGLDKQKQGQSVRRGVTVMLALSKPIKATNPCTD